ncbi:putative reverse transcriptase domain-containing protein [Tanacetum coccineum]|uniref:Reverse transcriptase domain-containing protein n=1 Tax=Tanacetum coccineum TaxID=301880 RepID=A0ABQ4XYY2_9ASTR
MSTDVGKKASNKGNGGGGFPLRGKQPGGNGARGQAYALRDGDQNLGPNVLTFPEVKGWLDEDLDNYHLKELRCSTQCHTQMSMWIIPRGVVLLILLMLGISFKFGISGLLHQVITTIADKIRDKDTSQSKQNLQSSSMTFIHKTLIIPSVLDSCFNSFTVCEVKRFATIMGENVYIRDLIDFDVTMFHLEWFVKYSANVKRTVADFSHAPPNEYSPSPNDKKQWSKDTEDPSWSTSFKTRRTQKTSSALEDFICVVFVPDRNIIHDKKCVENLAADHLSQLENPYLGKLTKAEIRDLFPEERLMEVSDNNNEHYNVLTESYLGASPEMRQHKSFNNVTMTHQEGIMGIDFMGPFPSSNGNKYVLVAINYMSKWVEAQAFPTNDARNIANILKKLFAQFGIPKALISDKGTHFCNYQMGLFTRKLKSRWYRPFLVRKDQKNGAIELYNKDGNEFIVNKQRVKPYQKDVLETDKQDDITLDDEGEVR